MSGEFPKDTPNPASSFFSPEEDYYAKVVEHLEKERDSLQRERDILRIENDLIAALYAERNDALDAYKDKCDSLESDFALFGDEHSRLMNDLTGRLKSAWSENAKLRAVLELIGAPKRSDGTYNRCREACEKLAKEALES